ncbi:2-amino-4-hydroxy-6-hydroxymethyldihydropteridinediphosphokinase [Desulfonispora thiosulfatigenes DSM 11270]|uniref:2-amino-4-hydroxy-6-hydroxymethyldihydropteridine diphosphokinase n=1 Tax=Desulfonispora thiosulfatigenes DSM 11270 TaxID=656914 RepID=A0A1W1VDZ3_DESTI|nr:2-amino-4-hydroxy-6-hydroxymethyldihydropteridine diphosphokinase [Desulfonispora thiosulfatigenes]SMB91545.1 2-amino-4-hydroxy-6-hydroxymethyldihydropteridinediphosphokinase [Desulfonispora thiosulfatigenes DSM 11270]
MNKERIFIALGSNMGDKDKNIEQALELMNEREIKVIKISSLIETEPYGYMDQERFVNAVAEVEYTGEPEELLKNLLEIEVDMKRIRIIHWGPRNIDLDIVLWGQQIIKQDNLNIPHTDMHNREFVLDPLAEIAPEIIHPVYNLSISELLDNLKQQ